MLLVLGIDGADPGLLARWAADGTMPVLGDLMARGTSGRIVGLDGFFIGSTWPSVITGCGPARHGIHRVEQLRSGTYDLHRPLDEDPWHVMPPFWARASVAGRRVAVLDVPLSTLDPRLDGVQTVEWGGHDAVFGFRAHPAGLADRILTDVGPYPLPTDCDAARPTAAEVETFVSGLERAVSMRTELTSACLADGPWDLLVQVFTESHCAGHQCWHLHDPTHPAHDPAVRAVIGDPLERIYRAIDRGLGAIVDQADADQVLVVAPHGMGPYRGAQFLLPEILERLGVFRPPPPPTGPVAGATRLARRGWRSLPGGVRSALEPLRSLRRERERGPGSLTGQVDVTSSHCFPVANGSPVGGIRLNLRGREPQGILALDEVDTFCETLRRDLLDLVDADSGRPVIEAVHRAGELFAGPRLDALPDLLVEWAAEPALGSAALAGGTGSHRRLRSPRIGTVAGTNLYTRTGEHRRDGLFALAGREVPGATVESVSLLDLHPTICRLMGLDVPGVDGTPLGFPAGGAHQS